MPLRRRWGPELLVLVLVGFVLPVAVAVHYGSISAPVSDDWAYDLSAYHLASHGTINMYHWGTINLIGQLFLAVPVVWIFGPHAWVLNVWTCFIGTAGLVAVDYLGRALQLSRRQALFAAVLLGAGPTWAILSTSFMTDIQSVSFMAMALAVAASDPRTDRIVTLRTVVALALAGFAFTIREPTGVAFAAIAISRLGRRGRPEPRSALRWTGIVAVFGTVLMLFYLWRRALASGSAESGADWSLSWFGPWWHQDWLLPLLGLMLAPIALLIRPIDVVRTALQTCWAGLFLGWAVVPILPIVGSISQAVGSVPPGGSTSKLIESLKPTLGNSFFDTSGLPDPGVGHDFLPQALAWILGLVAIGSSVVVVAAIVLGINRWASRTRHRCQPSGQPHYIAVMLAWTAAGSVLTWAMLIGSDRLMWDRYLLPGVMAASLLLLYLATRLRPSAAVPKPTWRAAVIGLTALAAVSLMVTMAGDGYTGSQWQYNNQFAASARGIPRSFIFANWTWDSSQEKTVVFSMPYLTCYVETMNAPDQPDDLDYVRSGSWVERYTYSMSATPQAAAIPACQASIIAGR